MKYYTVYSTYDTVAVQQTKLWCNFINSKALRNDEYAATRVHVLCCKRYTMDGRHHLWREWLRACAVWQLFSFPSMLMYLPYLRERRLIPNFLWSQQEKVCHMHSNSPLSSRLPRPLCIFPFQLQCRCVTPAEKKRRVERKYCNDIHHCVNKVNTSTFEDCYR